jgi:magnesium chelatase family protein
MLVAALNPCPCGHLGSRVRTCTCSAASVAAYRARLSGPLLDRLDLVVEVPALSYQGLAHAEPGETTAPVRDRVREARERQKARGPAWNARLSSADLGRVAALDAAGHALLERAAGRLGLSARAITRLRRVARTIADLAGSAEVRAPHLAETLQYRSLDRPIT